MDLNVFTKYFRVCSLRNKPVKFIGDSFGVLFAVFVVTCSHLLTVSELTYHAS